MVTDVAHVGGAQNGIADGMDEHIGVAVSQQAEGVGHTDAAQPQVAVRNQLVDVVAHAYAYLAHLRLRLPNRSFMPSRSNDRVKRMVWSRGLDCEVENT